MWLTDKARLDQTSSNYLFKLVDNEVYWDEKNNVGYIAPRKLCTDNYTMPFAINKSKYDVRPSHIHDIGCRYHKLIKINLDKEELIGRYIDTKNNRTICKNIPIEYLELVDISGNEVNNLFYRMMVDAGIPKSKCNLYRVGVCFNIGWFLSKPKELQLSSIYKEEI